MDIFQLLREMPSVQKVSNLYPERMDFDRMLTFLFFACPRVNGSGFRINPQKTGLTASYTATASGSMIDRVGQANAFIDEFRVLSAKHRIRYQCRCIFAAADALVLFPIPKAPPPTPEWGEANIELISNYEPMRNHIELLAEFRQNKPWQSLPGSVITEERQRLLSFLPHGLPDNIRQDYVERIFAGFCLDGHLIRKELFGENPIILGVEPPGVTMIQNSALAKQDWVPVIALRKIQEG